MSNSVTYGDVVASETSIWIISFTGTAFMRDVRSS